MEAILFVCIVFLFLLELAHSWRDTRYRFGGLTGDYHLSHWEFRVSLGTNSDAVARRNAEVASAVKARLAPWIQRERSRYETRNERDEGGREEHLQSDPVPCSDDPKERSRFWRTQWVHHYLGQKLTFRLTLRESTASPFSGSSTLAVLKGNSYCLDFSLSSTRLQYFCLHRRAPPPRS